MQSRKRRVPSEFGHSSFVISLGGSAVKDAVSEHLPLPLARQVDEVCDRFEDAWLEGRQPRIEEFLSEASEPARPALLRELLRIELEHRCRRGEQPAAAEYVARFPQ